MGRFSLHAEPLDLELKRVFTISRWSRTHAHNVVVRLEADGITGIGEGAPNARYQESQESALAFVRGLDLSAWNNAADIEGLIGLMDRHNPGEWAAKVAVEMAAWDWLGKSMGVPIHQLWNAASTTGPVTSYTIGIDEPDQIAERVREAERFPLLKVKLGTPADEDVIRHIRSLTGKPLMVDANEGWKDLDTARRRIRFMADMGITLVEQPMPSVMRAEMAELKPWSPLPLYADESFTGHESVAELAAGFHGVNLKIMKVGSLRRSMQLVQQARREGLGLMVGCMIESSLADTASALVALWADHADLDGHVLIRDDPYRGLMLDAENRVRLNDSPGLGVVPA